jgi:hypothetical protein
MAFWIGLIIGLLVGGSVGAFIMAGCALAKREDNLRGYNGPHGS